MKWFFLVVVVVSVMAALAFASVSESGDQGRRFLGIWEGIDTGDGSGQQFLISGGENGVFSLSWRETYWTVCDGRRAIIQGTGELDHNVIVMDIVITCFDPDEDVVADTVTFELVDEHMLFATAGSGVFVNQPLFRVSNRLARRRGDDDSS